MRRYPDDFAERRSKAFNVLLDVVARGIASGELRNERPLEVALGIWGTLHGLVSLLLAGRFGDDRAGFRVLCLRSLQRMFTGIGTNTPSTARVVDGGPGGEEH